MIKIWIEQKNGFLIFISTNRAFLFLEDKLNGLDYTHGAANYWAELDLNQRRHIANEFTVRPH